MRVGRRGGGSCGSIRTLGKGVSYVVEICFEVGGRGGGKYTVVVDEIRHRDAEEGAVEAGVETCDSFALDDAADGVVGG